MPSTDFYPVEVEQESVNRGKARTFSPSAIKQKVGSINDPAANTLARYIDRLLKDKMQSGTDGEKALAQSLHSSLINYLKRK